MERLKQRVVILISGRGSNMEAIIRQAQEGILMDCCEVVGVVSDRADALGLVTARRLGVKTQVVPSEGLNRGAYGRRLVNALEVYQSNYLLLAGFMRILSKEMITRYENRIINIHPADTAIYQGAHGYRWAFENGYPRTKITVHFVDEGIDTGSVIAQTEVNLEGATTLAEVEARGLAVEHRFYSEALRKIFKKETTVPIKRGLTL